MRKYLLNIVLLIFGFFIGLWTYIFIIKISGSSALIGPPTDTLVTITIIGLNISIVLIIIGIILYFKKNPDE